MVLVVSLGLGYAGFIAFCDCKKAKCRCLDVGGGGGVMCLTKYSILLGNDGNLHKDLTEAVKSGLSFCVVPL